MSVSWPHLEEFPEEERSLWRLMSQREGNDGPREGGAPQVKVSTEGASFERRGERENTF